MSATVLLCPGCGSDRLEIRQRTGFERMMAHFTPKRKYRCLICRHRFRALDRRRWPREDGETLESASKAGFPR
jgi:DNA-directed RNA polymerase subunit RPC12/RpoP